MEGIKINRYCCLWGLYCCRNCLCLAAIFNPSCLFCPLLCHTLQNYSANVQFFCLLTTSSNVSLALCSCFALYCVDWLWCCAVWLFLVMSTPLSWDSVSCCSGHLSCAGGGLGDSFASDSYPVSGICDCDLWPSWGQPQATAVPLHVGWGYIVLCCGHNPSPLWHCWYHSHLFMAWLFFPWGEWGWGVN